MFGHIGKILHVDLSKGRITIESLPEGLARKYVGGAGIQARWLYDWVTPDIDPLSAHNKLMFGVGPLVGTFAPMAGRATFTARSPLTGIFADSNVGGHFGLEFKLSGFDHVIFHGRAESPVYLWIDDGHVEIRDATHLWGKTTWETDDIIKEELGDDQIKTACIGPAGEKGVLFASIVCTRFRAAGKTGMGAVAGSKNLKAIAVRGSGGVSVARPDEFEKISNEVFENLLKHPLYETASTYGTLLHVTGYGGRNVLTTRCMSQLMTPEWAKGISLEEFDKRAKAGDTACACCPVHCTSWHHVRDGPFAGKSGQKPDVVLVTNFAIVCDVNDWGSIIAYHDFTNEYGMDAMELGLTLGMLMKWYEAGIIDKDTLNGIELKWGNIEAILAMAHNIAYRKGFGDIVSGGLRRTCKHMKMSDYGPPGHIKGVAFSGAGYDYRLSNIRALYYCTSPRGSDHLKGHVTFENTPSPEVAEKLFGSREILKPTSEDPAKGKVVKFHEDLYAVLHSAGLCLFGYFWFQIYDVLTMTKILNAATGWALTEQGLWTTGERIFNVMKSYNVRLGLTREDDYPPKWFRKTAVQWDVPAKGYVLNLDPLLDGYYDARGWDKETSWPTQRKLEELDLKDVAVDMANWHHTVRERRTLP